jgi:alkylglycerol monooxygenase
MNEKLIALSVPVFFVSMIVEFFLNRAHLAKNPEPRRLGSGAYRLADTFCNLACGIGNQLFDPVLRVAGFAAYAFCFTHGPQLFRGHETAEWVLGFIGVDFFYYWFHRGSHRVNLFWAAHAVHHQSEEYNLSVALRQPWFEKILDVPFYLPLAVVGVRPEVYMTSFTINLIYQFFLHATFVPKLGFLEYVLNTPSHHRVHHGIDPQYIDKNYGGMLIVWDRLFGSFEEEGATVHYGTVKPLSSYDPLWANLAVWAQLAKIAARTERFVDKVAIFFAPPEWLPADHGGPVVVPPVSPERRLFDPHASRGAQVLAGAALTAGTVALVWFLEVQSSLPMAALLGALAFAVLVLTVAGRALDADAPSGVGDSSRVT